MARLSAMVALLVGLLGVVAADLAPLGNLESFVAAFGGKDRRLGAPREELRKKMFEARMCHSACGKDAACHTKCPDPWTPLVQACRQVPVIMACYKKCEDDTACIKNCPSFAVNWIQEKLEKDPEHVFKKSEWICPELEKAHSCHHACTPGDFACHRKCPRAFDHHDKYDRHHGRFEDTNQAHVESATCQKCLAAGEDFCMSESKCIPRATFKCRGPRDHVTGDRWFALHGNPEGIQHSMTCPGSEIDVEMDNKPDSKGCLDKGQDGFWCKNGDDWHCVKNCKTAKELKPDAKGCYDKGDFGVWCPAKGDDWYCVKNCKDEEVKSFKPDVNGCHDKGKYGVWCPKGDTWSCVKNCQDGANKIVKPDARGCYDKGKHGVWCPRGNSWYCVKDCKVGADKEVKTDANGCFDKGANGVWCPNDGDWYCAKNCPARAEHTNECWLSAALSKFYVFFKGLISDLPDLKNTPNEFVV